jgi:hypothetical protein
LTPAMILGKLKPFLDLHLRRSKPWFNEAPQRGSGLLRCRIPSRSFFPVW